MPDSRTPDRQLENFENGKMENTKVLFCCIGLHNFILNIDGGYFDDSVEPQIHHF